MRPLLVLCAIGMVGCVEPALPEAADAGPAPAYVCSPTTCVGCCAGNACVGGNQSSACGYDGRACRACPVGTTCQSPGACVGDRRDGGFDEAFDPDAGGGLPTNPLTGNPLENPRGKCVWIFGVPICG